MRKRNLVFLFGGIIIGIMTIVPIISIGTAFMNYLNQKIIILPIILFSLSVFSLIQFIVSRKKFQTLKNFYLMSAVVSIGILILLTRIVIDIFQEYIINTAHYFENDESGIWGLIVLYGIIALSIAVFILTFSLITKHKSEYITYISKEVEKIAEDGNNLHIEEKGCDELAVLSRSINQMNEDMQENRLKKLTAEKQKNELITNVSHDLRSPLTSIIGYVELLKEYRDKNDEKFSEYIEVTDRRLKGLNDLINELFYLTKMDSPSFNLNLTEGNVSEFVKQFGFEMSMILSKNRLNLICKTDDTEFIIKADFERLARVMENLFANLLKYAEKDTDVILESKVGANSINISLSNTVPDKVNINTDDIFERFYCEDHSRSDNSSSGLGLAIAKKIITLHGGEISAVQKGSILTINIRLNN